jgi:hypothetical protein
MANRQYQERPILESSLFKGDQDYVSEEAVQRILSSSIQLPPRAKVAIFRYEGGEEERAAISYYGYYYWRTEGYIKAQQELVDSLQSGLLSSGRVSEATTLPSMLVPAQPSITMLRQAAVRLQADLLLVFRITSDAYYDFNLLNRDRVKAYSTCEVLLFDVRTGIIPFTTIVSRDVLRDRSRQEVAAADATRGAKQEASLMAITEVATELAGFLRSIRQ